MKTLKAGLFIAVLCAGGCTDRAGLPPNPPSPESKAAAPDRRTETEILAALRQIGDAFQKFDAAHGAMPSAAIFNRDGKPLLSWRVALLPYLNETALYEQFKLDEPWDSEHNQKLLAKMPAVYSPRRGPASKESYSTYYQVFTGQDAPLNLRSGIVIKKDHAFEGTPGPRISDFPDGTSQTFLVVESAEAVPWTKPADLVYEAGKPLPGLGFGDRFYLVLADGSPHFIKKSIAEDIIRGGITPRGQGVGRFNEKPREPVLFSDERSVVDQE